jgi:hypothetical protein
MAPYRIATDRLERPPGRPSLPQAARMTRTLATERAPSAVDDRAPTDPAGQPVTPTPTSPLADAPAAPTAAPREQAATSAPHHAAPPRLRLLRYEPATTPHLHPTHLHPFPPPPPGPIPPVAAGLARELTPDIAPEVTAAERTQAEQAVGRLLRAALEVLDRRRPSAHIAARVSPPVLRYLQLATGRRHARRPVRLRRMRLCLPRSGVAEVAVTCELDGRVRALAARFEHRRAGWCCTVLRLL